MVERSIHWPTGHLASSSVNPFPPYTRPAPAWDHLYYGYQGVGYGRNVPRCMWRSKDSPQE